MKNRLLVLFVSIFFIISREISSQMVDWSSFEGISRLHKACTQQHTLKLIQHYESQIRLNYCGIASAVIALNALAIPAGPSAYLGNYRLFTQEEFFSPQIQKVMSQEEVDENGIGLNEMEKVMKVLPLYIETFEAKLFTQTEIRSTLLNALKNPDQCILALYGRKKLGQSGDGHWSPVAAYDADSDSLLVLDVARYKYPPTWINTTFFIEAMQTSDENGYSRGFIILTKNH